jgi:nitroreductase
MFALKAGEAFRSYTDEPVLKEQVEAVLEAGVWAPTGMWREPWRFIVIENKELIKYVSDEAKVLAKEKFPSYAKHLSSEADVICYNAPVLILICTEKDQFTDNNLADSVLATEICF